MFGSVGMRLGRSGDPDAATHGLAALALLDADRTAGDVAWGYPFDVQTRWSFYPAGSPNVVVTSFAVQGLLDGAAGADQAHLRTRAVGRCADGCWMSCGSSRAGSSPITRRAT